MPDLVGVCVFVLYVFMRSLWADLLAHTVDAIGPQQVDGLLHQVGAAAVEHPEAQVLQELGLGGGSVQLPGGAETVLSSAEGGTDGGRE